MAAELTRAAGAILWRFAGPGLEVALVHRPRYDDWSFPKGKAKAGEHILRTVQREILEETGVVARLGPRLPSSTYLKDGLPKRVDYWSATVVSSTPFTPNDEIDEVVWVPIATALGMLSYERDASLLRTFADLPQDTRPVILLRHASAGEKRFWHGNDLVRPLDARGRWEAGELTHLLNAYAPKRLISSATARCVESLLSYAVEASLPIVTEPAFTVGSPALPSARQHLQLLLADGHDGLLVCTHGELIPDLVATVCAPYEDKTPDDPALRKSSFWVFHTTPTTLVSLERHSLTR